MTGQIVHEWLAKTGGSENVVETIAGIFPDAPIMCLWDDLPSRFEAGRVSETWLSRTPLRRNKAFALPFMPAVWRNLPEADADWVLCSSHLFAHHAQFSGSAKTARKYVYVHTPARYIWAPELDGRGNGWLARAISMPLKALDRKRAQGDFSIAANSAFIQQRIEMAWGRESQIIYPPVDVAAFVEDSRDTLTIEEEALLAGLPSPFILGASRFVHYKRLDVAIAAGVAAGVGVVLAGEGPDGPRLRALAEEHPGVVTFVSRPSHALLNQLYRRALAYVFPSIEDFGIMPVEAMATGTPVIANAIGGASESVVHGVTGALVHSFAPSALREAVNLASSSNTSACVSRAWEFDTGIFETKIRNWVQG
ncbi:glycosyltransferase [Leifsonia sp. A12D58]|uniref:glycosyltransferase n=1 Tax=Leifsonia sp. A12D58 TaxID=3397674 RepID=UPI0039DFEC64